MKGSVSTASTVAARLEGNASTARRLADALAETLAPEDAVAVFETDPDRWCVEIHFARPPDEGAVRALIAEAAGAEAAQALAFQRIAVRDWVAASLSALKPVAAGRFLVYGAHDRARAPVNRIGVEIEAALAFGTGHHGTTRGCLVALDAIAKRRSPRSRKPAIGKTGAVRRARSAKAQVLDVGAGTGVLAIAAAKALRRRVLAGDIDAAAVRVASGNVRINRVGSAVELVHAPGVRARRFRERAPFELVFANILLGPIKRLARPLARLLRPGAQVVLSGFLPAQANAALAPYAAHGLVLVSRIVLGGWVTLVLRKPGSRRSGAPNLVVAPPADQ